LDLIYLELGYLILHPETTRRHQALDEGNCIDNILQS